MARSVGLGEGYGDSEFPAPTIRGAAVQGGEDFYIQKLNRSEEEFDMETCLPRVNDELDMHADSDYMSEGRDD